MKIINILKMIEPYFVVCSYMFIGFFIVMTGVILLPRLVEIVREESYAPLAYSLSIMFGGVYFATYKVFKIIMEIEE